MTPSAGNKSNLDALTGSVSPAFAHNSSEKPQLSRSPDAPYVSAIRLGVESVCGSTAVVIVTNSHPSGKEAPRLFVIDRVLGNMQEMDYVGPKGSERNRMLLIPAELTMGITLTGDFGELHFPYNLADDTSPRLNGVPCKLLKPEEVRRQPYYAKTLEGALPSQPLLSPA